MSIMTQRFIGVIASALVAALLAGGPVVAAQKPVSVSDAVTETFTIEAIDSSARIVTLKDKEGNLEDVFCGPEVQRFDALKVGDTVSFRYYESVVSALRRPGQAARPAEAGGVTRTPGTRPGGTIAQQITATVTIQAIDAKIPSVTVKSDKGRVMSFRVQDAKNLEGYKVGDTVEVTYTQALAVSVEPAKK
jgi:Cu/Ag efflux protein CusF